ncbi:MAG TPA: hypothetical protein DDW85_01555 [Porphyromonadaceae bacterium]|nr:hypothetical protein [Porphyromonadaceae bacterium]
MRANGRFKYKTLQGSGKDENGLDVPSSPIDWIVGIECQIDKYVPAKQRIGVDGSVFTYSYEIFIPKYFQGKLDLTAQILLECEDGSEVELAILGIDNLNRKYIAVWG